MSYSFRQATLSDTLFLTKVIIEAEKSGSDKIGLAKVFDLTEDKLQNYLVQIFNEEITGCEFSYSSFIIAEFESQPVAGFAGWIEKENEDDQSSSILKSNLISFIFPKIKLLELKNKQDIFRDLQIEREAHTHQLEFAYVDQSHRGNKLTNRMIDELLKIAKGLNPNIKKSQVQVLENNLPAIRAYKRAGYKQIIRLESSHPSILKYLSCNAKLVLEKNL